MYYISVWLVDINMVHIYEELRGLTTKLGLMEWDECNQWKDTIVKNYSNKGLSIEINPLSTF